mgnify:CR=1 FL=1
MHTAPPIVPLFLTALSAILEACSEGLLTPFIPELAPLLDKILCSDQIDSLIETFSNPISLTSCVQTICNIQIIGDRCKQLKEYLSPRLIKGKLRISDAKQTVREATN